MSVFDKCETCGGFENISGEEECSCDVRDKKLDAARKVVHERYNETFKALAQGDDEQAAVFYWQDKLAKFCPTSKGPSGVEVDMFVAGLKQGREEKAAPSGESIAVDAECLNCGSSDVTCVPEKIDMVPASEVNEWKEKYIEARKSGYAEGVEEERERCLGIIRTWKCLEATLAAYPVLDDIRRIISGEGASPDADAATAPKGSE